MLKILSSYSYYEKILLLLHETFCEADESYKQAHQI